MGSDGFFGRDRLPKARKEDLIDDGEMIERMVARAGEEHSWLGRRPQLLLASKDRGIFSSTRVRRGKSKDRARYV